MIWGRKTITLPTPAMIPSQIRLLSTPSGRAAPVSALSWSKPAVIRSMIGLAPKNTAWNIRNSTPIRIARPATGCRSTSSSRPVQVSGRLGGLTQAFRMRSASR